MVFKLIIPLIAAALVLGSESGAINVPLNGVKDSSSDTNLHQVQALLSQHIADLSALLGGPPSDNSLDRAHRPVEDVSSLFPGVAPGGSPASSFVCDCAPGLSEQQCIIVCGHHSGGRRQKDIVLNRDQAGHGILPPRFLCDCASPTTTTCINICSNHGGSLLNPPNEAEAMTSTNDQDGHRPLPANSAPLHNNCDCPNLPPNHPKECDNICPNHGGRAEEPNDPHVIPPNVDKDGPQLQSADSAPVPQPARLECDCANPTLQCVNVCHDHGGSGDRPTNPPNEATPSGQEDQRLLAEGASLASSGCDCAHLTASSPSFCINICSHHIVNGSLEDSVRVAAQDQVTIAHRQQQKQRQVVSSGIHHEQNATILWTTGAAIGSPHNAAPATGHDHSHKTRLTIRGTTSTPIVFSAEVDLTYYASFVSSSAIQTLGLVSKVQPSPTQAHGARGASVVEIHDSVFDIVGVVPLAVSYSAQGHNSELADLFYVVAPKTASPSTLPELVIGIDLLQKADALTIKDGHFV